MKKLRPSLCLIVKALRLALGYTQQQFAQRMGWPVSTVVRYENTRPPKGAALILLERVACIHAYKDFAELLRSEIRRDVQINDSLLGRMIADADRKAKG